jgi:hypothetical protein
MVPERKMSGQLTKSPSKVHLVVKDRQDFNAPFRRPAPGYDVPRSLDSARQEKEMKRQQTRHNIIVADRATWLIPIRNAVQGVAQ